MLVNIGSVDCVYGMCVYTHMDMCVSLTVTSDKILSCQQCKFVQIPVLPFSIN